MLIPRCWNIDVDVEIVNQNVKTAWSLNIFKILEFLKLNRTEDFGDPQTQ